MFDALKETLLLYIQNHDDTLYKFKRTGIHRISGPNSAGKSVLMKSYDMLFFGEYLSRKGRRSMIQKGRDFGIISTTSYNGINLTLFLHVESKHTYYELKMPDNSPDGYSTIRKYIIDDYKELLKVANFHFMEEDRFSLNRYKTKTTLPFTHFSGGLNNKILKSASEDSKLTYTLETLDEELRNVRLDKSLLEQRMSGLQIQINTLVDSTLPTKEVLLKKVELLEQALEGIEGFHIPLTEALEMEDKKKDIDFFNISILDDILPSFQMLNESTKPLEYTMEAIERLERMSGNIFTPMNMTNLFGQLNKLALVNEAKVDLISSLESLADVKENSPMEPLDIRTLTVDLNRLLSQQKVLGAIIDLEGNKPEESYLLNIANSITTLKELLGLSSIPLEIVGEKGKYQEPLIPSLLKLEVIMKSLPALTEQGSISESISNEKEKYKEPLIANPLDIKGILKSLPALTEQGSISKTVVSERAKYKEPLIASPLEISSTIKSIKHFNDLSDIIENILNLRAPLTGIELRDYLKLNALLNNIENLIGTEQNINTIIGNLIEKDTLLNELDALNNEINTIHAQLDTCELCGAIKEVGHDICS